ncbi:MAG: family 16 glycoside hydrolase [Planctomycetota bacterium]
MFVFFSRIPYSAVFALVLLAAFGTRSSAPIQADENSSAFTDSGIRSVAQASGDRRTASEADVDALLDRIVAADGRMTRMQLGTTAGGRPIHVLAIESATPIEDPINVLILGGIHSGECCGKEALIELAAEMIAGQHKDWLREHRLFFVPSYNADGNSSRDINNRPGQVGPAEGMGQRPNSEGLDLNRDFMKLNAPETRGLIQFFNEQDIHIFVDLHTTNGSVHRYELTYDPPHHPNTPTVITSLLRDRWFPEITQTLGKRGFDLFYYGNFDRGMNVWSTFGSGPRYSTNYFGVRGGIGILSEAHSYATYRQRIDASREFVTEILNRSTRDAEQVRKACTPLTHRPGELVALTTRLTSFQEPANILSYDPPRKKSDLGPNQNRQPKTYPVRFDGRFQAKLWTTMPLGYWVPKSQSEVIELLKAHGIEARDASKSLADSGHQIAQFQIESINIAPRSFQKIKMRTASGAWQSLDEVPDAADFVFVPTDTRLGLLATLLLEPQSDDGVVAWDRILITPKQPYPILRIEEADVESKFQSLVQDDSLDGWEGDKNWFRIEDGVVIAGSPDKTIPHNYFLCTEKSYGDFELRLEIKLTGEGKNAGVQIRSRRVPENTEVSGYQADAGIAWNRPVWGGIYDESRRNRMLAMPNAEQVQAVLKPDDFNAMCVRCVGDRIQVLINDELISDYRETDPEIPRTGIIGLQIHSGKPAQAFYRNARIREL